MTMGPFDTSYEALAAALEAAEFEGPILAGLIPGRNRELLSRALGDAGVVMGRYDERLVEWLAGWEPSTVAVVTGWVERAYEAGKQEGAG